MKEHSNATAAGRETTRPHRAQSAGVLWGGLGVLAFSFTLPATRLADRDLDSTVVGLGRAIVASVLAALLLWITRQRLPPRRLWGRLAIVAFGVIIGFPLFTTLAMRLVPAAHGAIIVGVMPLATAIMAVLRAHERPSARFWIAALVGLVAILAFAVAHGTGQPLLADGLILVAVACAALGYAEGGVLARELGGWQVICWALVLAAPVLAPFVIWRVAVTGFSAAPAGYLGFAYVSLVSMFLGFFAWYRGLALGGVARIGQLQLVQPLLTLLWSVLFLGEQLSWSMFAAALVVLASVVVAVRARVVQVPAAPRESRSVLDLSGSR